jgi:hypothetical protein
MLATRDAEWPLALDDADPLHQEMLAYLRAIRTRGRYSPVRRILTRWAGMGYLLELGRIPGGGAADPSAVFDALAAAGLLDVRATPETVAEALGALGGAARSASRPRLDLEEAHREIAAIAASADGIEFE